MKVLPPSKITTGLLKLGVHNVNILYFTYNYRIVEKQGLVGSLVDCTSEGAALGALPVKIIRVSRMMIYIL